MNKTKYGVDTVAFLRYLTETLSSKTDHIFHLAESSKIELIVPSIVIGELIYTIEKGKEVSGKTISQEKLEIILATIFSTQIFSVADLNPSGWNFFMESQIPELHDRIIVATCLQENVEGLLTSDKEIAQSKEIKIVW